MCHDSKWSIHYDLPISIDSNVRVITATHAFVILMQNIHTFYQTNGADPQSFNINLPYLKTSRQVLGQMSSTQIITIVPICLPKFDFFMETESMNTFDLYSV